MANKHLPLATDLPSGPTLKAISKIEVGEKGQTDIVGSGGEDGDGQGDAEVAWLY